MFSSRANNLKAPPIYELVELARKFEDSIYMNLGDPDFDTPDFVKEAAVKAIRDGKTHYTGSLGLLKLREAIADYESRYLDSDITLNNIIITNGGTTGLAIALLAFVNPGDEVIVSDPWWPGHPRSVAIADARMINLKLEREEGFKLDVDKLNEIIGDKTRAIILNNPNNPTGRVFTESELRGVLEVAEDNDIVVIADEVYDMIVYNGSFISLGRLADSFRNLIIVRSFSKNFAMSGWRVGYIVAEKDYLGVLQKLNSAISLSQVSISQLAALALFENWDKTVDFVKKCVNEYRRRRDIVTTALRKAGIFDFVEPQGTFYIFPWLRGLDMKSIDFVKWLINEARVLVAPGYLYFGYTGEGHIRISYSIPTDKVEEGMNRLVEAVQTKLI